jgi:hypothetical protein
MTPILVLLSLVVFLGAGFLISGAYVDRVRRRQFAREQRTTEFGFWDDNVLAAIHGGAVQ